MIDFFTFWVYEVCGNILLSILVTAVIFAIIAMVGRMSYMLLTMLLVLFFITFGVGFLGIIVYLPLILLSGIYFGIQVYKYFTRE